MSKKVSLLLSLLMVVSLFAGCVDSGPGAGATPSPQPAEAGGDGTEDGGDQLAATDFGVPPDFDESKVNHELSGRLTFWSWGDYDMNGASDFAYYYPNVETEWIMVPNFEEKFQSTVAAGGELPDVMLMEVGRRANEMAFDLWENLEEAPYNFNRDDIVDWAIPLMENERGEIVCVQWDMCQTGLLYRRDLAMEYFGIEEPEEMEARFQTWDDMLAAGKELTEASGGEVKLFAGSDDAFQALASKVTEPLVVDGRTNFEEEYLECFQLIEQMTADEALGYDIQFSPSWNTSYSSGKVLFWPCPTWMIPWTLKPNEPDGNDKYGLMDLPGGASSWGGTAGAIPKDKPEETKQLAWTWISWLTTTMEGARSFSRINAVPTCYAGAVDADFYTYPDPYFKGQDIMQKYLSMDDIEILP